MQNQLINIENTDITKWDFESIKKELAAALSVYETTDYSAELIKVAKADKSVLSKAKTIIENLRKAYKAKCMQPYYELEDNIELLVKQGFITFEEAIGTREDVYELLIGYGVDKYRAYIIAEYVRKGRVKMYGWDSEMSSVMTEARVPVWFTDSCKKIFHLWSRSDALVRLKGQINKIEKWYSKRTL